MEINRAWAMPSKNTFTIKPINKLIKKIIRAARVRKCVTGGAVVVDPFSNAGEIANMCDLTNDLDPDCKAGSSLDALEFLKKLPENYADVLLFDPPYSPRQVSECYKKLGKTVNMQTTQASFWGNLKKEIARVCKHGAVVVSFGWNSGGIGKAMGFEIEEILLVAHGGWHNDTICTVEKKVKA